LWAFQFDETTLEGIASCTATSQHAPSQPYSLRDERFALRRREAKSQADVIATLHQALLNRLLRISAITTSTWRRTRILKARVMGGLRCE
jgi:hypothetical protein